MFSGAEPSMPLHAGNISIVSFGRYERFIDGGKEMVSEFTILLALHKKYATCDIIHHKVS